MPKKSKPADRSTLVTFLLDRSGSMQSIKADTIGGFNAYLDTLQADGKTIVFSFLQFDNMSLDVVCKNIPVAKAVHLTDATFQPRGMTPLVDAAYKTIKAIETAIAERGDDPQVVVCIQTDGMENSSVEHTSDELKTLIEAKTGLGWQFNFMGASVDAYGQAMALGIGAINTMSYNSFDEASTQSAFFGMAQNTTSYAAGRASNTNISASMRSAAGDNHANKYAAQLGAQAPAARPPAKPRRKPPTLTL